MQALIFVHKDDVEKANEIAEKLAGPQAKNTFDVPYDKDWFVACWTMSSSLYNELKDAGICMIDYKKEKDKKKEEEKEKIKNETGKIVSLNDVSSKIDRKQVMADVKKEKIKVKPGGSGDDIKPKDGKQ